MTTRNSKFAIQFTNGRYFSTDGQDCSEDSAFELAELFDSAEEAQARADQIEADAAAKDKYMYPAPAVVEAYFMED